MSQLRNFQGSETIEPGECVLISQSPRRHGSGSQILIYFLAVVCTEPMLPTRTARWKPAIGATVQNGPFPVWLIGKSEFRWVLRAQMYHIGVEANRAGFLRIESKSDFATYLTLAQENNHNLAFWADVILEHKRAVDAGERNATAGADRKRLRQNNNDLVYGENDADNTDDSHLEDSDYEGPVRTKSRSTTKETISHVGQAASRSLIASSPPLCMVGPPSPPLAPASAPYTTPAASPEGGIIKPEPSDADEQIPAADLVKVFVGKSNDEFFECSRDNLAQSAVLSECITTRDGGCHIMEPGFSGIDPSEFKAVVQFLNAHEYEPFLLHSDGRSFLDDSAAPIDYSKDLVRSAGLFNLAKRFQLPALAHLVFRKILHGHQKYATQAFLSFASIILKYQEWDFKDEDEIKSVLEDWIIKFLAENMQTVLSQITRDTVAFWELMKVEGVEVKVLEKRLELCKKFPGGRFKVED